MQLYVLRGFIHFRGQGRVGYTKRRGPPEAGGLPSGPSCQTGHLGEVERSGAHLFVTICRRLIHLEGTDALDIMIRQIQKTWVRD
jgi:hypothetical protein